MVYEPGPARRHRRWLLSSVAAVVVASGCAPSASSPVDPPPPLVVTSASDTSDPAPGDGTCGSAPDGCTLRAALEEANARPGPDRIGFDAAATDGVVRIRPGAPLPVVVDHVVVDGLSQPGARATTSIAPAPLDGRLVVELRGPGTRGSSALVLGPGSAGSEVRGLSIGGFDDAVLVGDDGVVVAGNHIGVDATGLVPVPNLGCGVSQAADDSDDARIGGTDPADRNLVSANGECAISPNTASDRWVIQGNYLGTDRTGTRALANLGGGAVSLDRSAGHLVGGAEVGAANLISGNETFGIAPEHTQGVRILGNLIGTDHTGTVPLPNLVGVGIAADTSVEVGGPAPGEGNLIAGNGWMDVSIGGDGSVVSGNRIGVLADGRPAPTDTWYGVALGLSATGNLVGGRAPGAGNEIAGQGTGVLVLAGAGRPADNEVVGNDLHDHEVAGIDLATDTDGDYRPDLHAGPDPAGAGPDGTGPNGQQPAPVVVSAGRAPGLVDVHLLAPPSPDGTPVVLDLYAAASAHPSGYGEGRVLLGSLAVPAGASVRWAVSVPSGGVPIEIGVVSATATAASGRAADGRGATSEFSAAVAAGST